jgi:hypothetical protein
MGQCHNVTSRKCQTEIFYRLQISRIFDGLKPERTDLEGVGSTNGWCNAERKAHCFIIIRWMKRTDNDVIPRKRIGVEDEMACALLTVRTMWFRMLAQSQYTHNHKKA